MAPTVVCAAKASRVLQAPRLSRLTEDLLLLAKMDGEEWPISKSWLDAAGMVEGVKSFSSDNKVPIPLPSLLAAPVPPSNPDGSQLQSV